MLCEDGGRDRGGPTTARPSRLGMRGRWTRKGAWPVASDREQAYIELQSPPLYRHIPSRCHDYSHMFYSLSAPD